MVLTIRTTGVEDFLQGGNAFMKALIMGAPGVGKTRSASFWPKPVFADCEKGRMSLADRSVPYAEIKNTSEMDALLKMLWLECKKPLQQRQFQTLVIDTLDAYQRIVMQERLDAENKAAFSGWQDWGYLDGKMTQFIAKLHQLDMNIVVNLHIKDTQIGDDDAKIAVMGPKLKGDLKDQISAEFDLVGYMGTYYEAHEGERVLRRGIQWWSDPSKPMLKDRSGQLPKWTAVNFTDDDYANLFGHVVSGADKLQESQHVLTLETDEVLGDAAPVAPKTGGPVGNTAITPPASNTKAASAPPAGAAVQPVQPTPVVRSSIPPAAKRPPAAAPATPAPVGAVAEAAAPAVVPATPEPSPAPTPPVTAAPAPEVATAPAQESVADVAPVAEPVATAPVAADVPAVTLEQAVENVQAGIGGEVITPTAPVEAPPTEVASAPDPVAQAVDAVFCGTAWPDGSGPGQVTGCGQQIVTTKQGGTENPDVVEIAQLRTRTNLCEACFAAHRASK